MINPLLITDGYKLGHPPMLPPGTTKIINNYTPRGSRLEFVKEVVLLGLQYYIKRYLIHDMNEYFFNRPKDEVIKEWQRYVDCYTGKGVISSDHIEALHMLGYLPIEIRSIPEGTSTPVGIPQIITENTHDDFAWLTNHIEPLMSNCIWGPSVCATLSREFRKVQEFWGRRTCPERSEFFTYQSHDFSLRGMLMPEAAMVASGLGHLLCNDGTDNFPALMMMEKYYGAKLEDYPPRTIPAMEHSIMCVAGKENELATIKRMITEVYPTGNISIIADTWNLWKVLVDYLPELKETIMNREGTVVFRPDSSWTNPQDILCGMDVLHKNVYNLKEDRYINAAIKGVVQILGDIFGTEDSSTGYKVLDSHVSAVYGDSITIERASEVNQRLASKGFASTNVVYGVGSFTYQYNTRDTFKAAIKATAAVVNGEYRSLYKDPITDLGDKKSARGLLGVTHSREGSYRLVEDLNPRDYSEFKNSSLDAFETVFVDGSLKIDRSWDSVGRNALRKLNISVPA